MDRIQKNQSTHPDTGISNPSNHNQSKHISSEKTRIVTPSDPAVNIPSQDSDIAKRSDLQGKTIRGRYKIEAAIGHGGMCDVYRAKDLLLEAAGVSSPYVALKVLQKEYLNQPGAAKILIREAQKTQQLSHPNIIRVYDFGGDKQAHYLVMEWLDGETLEEVIQRSRPNGLSYHKAMKLLNQVISALSYAHGQGVVHADLKPSNIMLNRDGTIKIFDFGVARALNLNADYYAAEIRDETNALSGYTPTYASPNLLQGHEPDIQDDIFAFSCIAYELLTSQHPFNRKPADIAEKSRITATKPKNISSRNWRILRRGLEFPAEQRIASFTKLNEHLNKHYWPLITSLATACCIAGAVGYGYLVKEAQIQQLSSSLALLQQNVASAQQLSSLPASELIAVVPTLPDNKQLVGHGLLRQKREQILDIFEKKISTILNNRSNRYPDYYAIKLELRDAQSLYPDSLILHTIADTITTSWESTVNMMVQRINTLLEKGDYLHNDNGADIFKLFDDLNKLKKDYTFQPTSKAEETFAAAFAQARDELDLTNLQSLLNAGELFFSNNQHHKAFLASGNNLKETVRQMADYQQQLSDGLTPNFPYQAATVLYGNKFAAFDATVKQATKLTQLDKVGGDINQLAESLPDDFPPLNQIRLTLAGRYLTFSDQLLKEGKERTASTVMKKANKLFAQVEANRTVF